MELTSSERNIILVSLDHMEEHLFIIYEAGDITPDTFKNEHVENRVPKNKTIIIWN